MKKPQFGYKTVFSFFIAAFLFLSTQAQKTPTTFLLRDEGLSQLSLENLSDPTKNW